MLTDYYQISELLSPEHRLVQQSLRQWVDRHVKPIIDQAHQQHQFPAQLFEQMGQLGVFGPFLPPEYGCAGLDYTAYGLMMQELERGDSSLRSAASVQSSLVMLPIFRFGSEQQRQHYLPRLARGELIGAFGLTEPDHGSDPSSMKTRLSWHGDHWRLDGAKMWITNAPVCHLAVVWARDEQGLVRGVLVERGAEGFTTPSIERKWSLRASPTGELVFDNVRIEPDQLLPQAQGLKAPLSCLNSARYGIAWGAIGAAIDCYETALRYTQEREQFGKPIAAFQLSQKKLAEAITEITKAQLLAWRLSQLQEAGKASPEQISMAKRNNVHMALSVAREMRQLLGAMGISGDFPLMRHLMNLESVITYEGTHEVHLLITGMDITGINAFK